MKDIAITLSEKLWYFICSGRKKIELRKSIPVEFDKDINKCWVIKKGSSMVMGFFFIESFREDKEYMKRIVDVAIAAAVSEQFVKSYYQGYQKAYIWKIGWVCQSIGKYDRFEVLGLKYNPQSFVYVDRTKLKVSLRRVQ